MKIIHLHNHTSLGSLRDGFSKIPDLVSRVKELGMDSAAVTDHGSMTATIEFYNECRKQNIKPLIGLECYFTPEILIKDRKLQYHLILLAYNKQGYKNLLKLNTEAHESFYYKPRVSIDILEKYKDGLFCLSACLASIINTDNGEEWASKFKAMFGDKFYLELQPNSMPEQKEYNLKLIELSKKLDIEMVVTVDCHYIYKSDAPFHRMWVSHGKETEYYSTDDYYIMDESDVRERLSYLDENIVDSMIKNTHVIADMCNVEINDKDNLMPKYECEDHVEELKKYCRIGWKNKIIGKIPKEEIQTYTDRFFYELDALTKGNYVDYMLIINDILLWCRNNNVQHGFGRGSVGGSLIAWLLNFTAVDPIKHELLFERFINPSRTTLADVDLDLEARKREDVLNYLKTKYKYVLPIITTGYVKDKSAIQIAGKLLKMEPSAVDLISKNIETIDDVKGNDELKKLAKKFVGLADRKSQHASGFIVMNADPTEYCSMERQNDFMVLNQEYHTLEKFGFLKLDLLSLNNLDIIQETKQMIPEVLDLWNLPLDDSDVYKQYAKGDLNMIFQCESPLMQQYAKRLKVSCFEDLVALLSICRPAVITTGMADKYIECKNTQQFTYIHPALEPILKKTNSSLIFQESVMQICQSIAGMTLAEADNMRRIMGRKLPEELNQILPTFIEGCKKNNIDSSVAEQIAKWLTDSSSYLFNHSHAASYAYLSYLTAWLKFHYPHQYMCAALNCNIENQDKSLGYIYEAKRVGIPILPPDLNNSLWTVQNNSLKIGYSYVKNVSKELTTTIPAEMNKRQAESLIKAGCFGENYNQLLSDLEYNKTIGKKMNDILAKLDTELSDKKRAEWECKLKSLPDRQMNIETTNADRIKHQIEVLGFSFYEKEVGQRYQVDSLVPQIVSGELIEFKPRKDKKNKPMAFLKVRTPFGIVDNLVMFHRNYCELSEGQQYQMVVKKNIVEEVR